MDIFSMSFQRLFNILFCCVRIKKKSNTGNTKQKKGNKGKKANSSMNTAGIPVQILNNLDFWLLFLFVNFIVCYFFRALITCPPPFFPRKHFIQKYTYFQKGNGCKSEFKYSSQPLNI